LIVNQPNWQDGGMQKTLVAALVDTAHIAHPGRVALDGAPMLTSRSQLTLDRSTLEKLLHHAAFAAHLVGHLDDDAHRDLIRQIGDRIDTIAHELAELLGAPSALAEPDDRKVRDGAPMLTAITGGAL
jgi:hypothetical protein